jgi:hypothetical protein
LTFVPLFVTTLMMPPAVRPSSAENELVSMRISRIESTCGRMMTVPMNRSLLSRPSMRKLF